MEKKTRTIGILLLVLLALLITFFGLKKWNTSKSEAEEKKKKTQWCIFLRQIRWSRSSIKKHLGKKCPL